MGTVPQSRLTCRLPGAGRDGIALPGALMALVLMGILSAAALMLADLNAKAGQSRVEAARAMHIAESGLAHALALGRGPLGGYSMTRILRGSDDSPNTTDDGRLIGYGLASDVQIPVTGRSFGGGSYFVTVTDDPADPNSDPRLDGNNQVLVTCFATLPNGASASVSAVVRTIQLPGVIVDGDLEISGKLALTGSCGGIHANGNLTGGGQPTVSTLASATGTVSVSVSPKQSGAPFVNVPDMSPALNCPPGGVSIISTTWKPSSLANNTTYCVSGNFEDGNLSDMTSVRNVSIIAGGSIKIAKKLWLKAFHPDGIVMLAGGDMDIQAEARLEGLVYAGAQCYISSKPTIIGQFICKNKSPHPGANYVPINLISGDAEVNFQCGGVFNQSWRILAWYPNFGS